MTTKTDQEVAYHFQLVKSHGKGASFEAAALQFAQYHRMLVSDEGEADSIAGQLLQATDALASEWRRNGYGNWNDYFEGLVNLLRVHLPAAYVDEASQVRVAHAVDAVQGIGGEANPFQEPDRVHGVLIEGTVHYVETVAAVSIPEEILASLRSANEQLATEGPVWDAVFYGDLEQLRYYHEEGYDLTHLVHSGLKYNALHGLLYFGKHPPTAGEVTAFLIEIGVDVNAIDARGDTPLHHAADSGLLAAARLLIEAGADVNATSHVKMRPLFLAIRGGQPSLEVVELLLESGAIVDSDLLQRAERVVDDPRLLALLKAWKP